MTTRTTREPGALDASGLRRAVVVLSTVQIVSWGVLYYVFAAVQSSITSDTGWSATAVTGAFSLALVVAGAVGIWVGRHIDAYGPRRVMTGASVIAVPGVLAVALAPSLVWFYAGWALVGVAMAGTLYPPAFAALTRWGGVHRVGALTTLTLVAGLASTVFVPLATALDDQWGWRTAYLVLLAALALVTVPLHWFGLAHPWEPHPEVAPASDEAAPSPATRTRAFVALTVANALTALTVFAVVVNTVPMLLERGLDRELAAWTLGLGGVGQVLGRLGYARFASVTTVTQRGVVVVGAVAATTAAMALVPDSAVLLVGVGMLVGLARGVYTLVQATAVTDRWGPAAYGRLNGVLSAPMLVATALSPFVGAALAELLGSYADAFLVLAALSGFGTLLMLAATPNRPPPD